MITQLNFLAKDYYPCIFISKDNSIVTCWCTPQRSTSQLLKTKDDKVVYFSSMSELKNCKKINDAVHVHYDEIAEYNYDQFLQCVNNIRPYKSIDVADCKILLNALNMFQDVLFTLNIPNREYKLPRMRPILSKLFYGCNLPALSHPKYHPSFKPYDIKVLKKVSHSIWQKIIKKEPIFNGY